MGHDLYNFKFNFSFLILYLYYTYTNKKTYKTFTNLLYNTQIQIF